MGILGQCLARTDRQNGSTSQKKECCIPAHDKPRSQSPTPENKLPTCKRLLRMAVPQLGAGARGPHVIDGPASRTFDAQVKSCPLGKHLVAVSTPNFVVFLHFLSAPCLRPHIRPDMRLRARHEHKHRRILCMICPYHVGPWSGIYLPGRWGSSQLPRLCLKFVFFLLFSPDLGKSPGAAFTAARRCSKSVC